MPLVDVRSHQDLLSSGELSWLERRRAGESLNERSVKLGITRADLIALEKDRIDTGLDSETVQTTAAEHCALCRRRSGITTGREAAELGISRVTLARWEAVGDPRALAYWVTKS